MIPVNDLKRGYLLFKDEYDKKAIQVLESGWYVLGQEVQKFEEEFAKKIGSKYCIGVDNGLNAISLGIKALGIKEGDEVIVQANTYIATCLGVTANGAKVVLVEPDEYYNLDFKQIEKAITLNTKAVLITHLYGQATRMDEIVKICREHNLYLLEDCAQSHFAACNGKNTGTFGTMGFFSFYPTKNLGCFGDGGAIVTNSDKLNSQLRTLRNYGSEKKYHNMVKGNNSRLDEMQAGFLRVKLSHIEELTRERTRIADYYNHNVTNKKIILPNIANCCTSVYHLYVVQVQNRDEFRSYMHENGILTDVHYPIPPHLSQAYSDLNYKIGDFPISERYANSVVSLPIFNGMTGEEMETVASVVNGF